MTGELDYNKLIPPSNPDYPWVPENWKLLCYYCNQPIHVTQPVAGYRQRTVFLRGMWLHDNDSWHCDPLKIRPLSEIDEPRCHICGMQNDEHRGSCSAAGRPSYHATPMSDKEEEVWDAASRASGE